MKPFRTRERAQDWFRTDLPKGVLVPAPARRRHPGIRAAASLVPWPVRRLATSVASEAAVMLLLAAALALFHQTALAQLAPPSPPAAVCGNGSILNGPPSPPAGAVTVPAGDNSGVNFSTPGATYWFATGTHTIGSGQFSQIQPGNNSTFTGAPGAVIDGQGINNFAIVSNATGVTIQYLTIQNFTPPGSQGAINQNGAPGWTVTNDTVQDNLPGAAMMLGTNEVVANNCLTENGEYGFNGFSVQDVSTLTGGPSNIMMTGNEISFNDVCNWEAAPAFPITPPAGCGGVGFNGCGCSGGGKFWETDQGVFSDNYVHDNYGPAGVWWDTNNTGWNITGNYISGTYGFGLIYEISYNANITGNTFVRNSLDAGPFTAGFPLGAVYISESGSDSRVPGFGGGGFRITGNGFYDNWGGVILWENANRYCSSSANTSGGTCTIVNRTPPTGPVPKPQQPGRQSWRRGLPPPGRTYGVTTSGQPVISLNTCSTPQLLAVTPYIDDCRWKTQNVTVAGNTFDFSPSDLGPACNTTNLCGFNGVFSQFGTFPPYTGTFVENNITFSQGNLFSGNTYCGPWQFDALAQGNVYSYTTWQGPPYNQDPGSTLNGPACQAVVRMGPPRAPVPAPVVVPVRAGRR